ncbi:MAG: ComEC/Rec2 family competence protein [Elusimicrobiota bacterium]|nr:ComEC/Rec2 family competence protein [Elusimicrobiota bacterium]
MLLPSSMLFYTFFLIVEYRIIYDNLLYLRKEPYQYELVKGKVYFIKEEKNKKIFIIKTRNGSKYYIQTDRHTEEFENISYGDQVSVLTLCRTINLQNNYDLFLFNSYDVQKIGYAVKLEQNFGNQNFVSQCLRQLYFITTKVKQTLVEISNKKLNSPINSVILRVILGYEDEEIKDVKIYFQDAGVAHVLVVSGLHVGFVFILTYFLLKLTFLRYEFKIILSCIVVLFYMFITGCSSPVVRATIIVITIAAANLLKQKQNSIYSLILAAFIILLFSPRSLFNPSFQLSFAACFGIVYFYPFFYQHIKSSIENKNIVFQYFVKLFITTFSAQIMILPLIIYYFNKVSTVSIVSNIFVIPLTCLLLWLGMISYLVEFLSSGYISVLWQTVGILGEVFLSTVKFFANLPYAKLNITTPSSYAIIIYYLLTVAIAKLIKKKSLILYLGILILSTGILIFSNSIFKKRIFKIKFFDLNFGESVLIKTPCGRTVLIDTGGDEKVAKFKIIPELYKDSLNKIDYLIITHAHYPHYGGAKYIISNFKVKKLYTSNYVPPWTSDYKEIFIDVLKRKIEYEIIHTSRTILVNDNVEITVIPNYVTTASDEIKLTDYNSLLVTVRYKNAIIVLSNDLPGEYILEKLSMMKLKDKFLLVQLPRHGKYEEDVKQIEHLFVRNKDIKLLFYIITGNKKFIGSTLRRSSFTTKIFGNISVEIQYSNVIRGIKKIVHTKDGLVIEL